VAVPHAAAAHANSAVAAARTASLHRLRDGLDTAVRLRLNHVRLLSGRPVSAVRRRKVEANLSTRRPWPVADVLDTERHTLLELNSPLRTCLLFEHVSRQLALQ
jgi:hypothetical protein